MPCYSPLKGWPALKANPSGKRSIVFNPDLAMSRFADPVSVPCGQCIGCRLEYSRQWAMRCVHEASQHDENCFITLTYAPEHLPAGGRLVKKHFQKFMKRLRRRTGKRFSFFHCGEYGEDLARPHYHALLFGFDFADKVPFKKSSDGSQIFTSKFLEDVWTFGFATVGAVTFESAAYCARYAVKKRTGRDAAKHYEKVDYETGEIYLLPPEYVTMSLRPAIAKGWFTRFSEDVYPSDEVVMRGREMRPPKYYDKILEAENPPLFLRLKAYRVAKAERHAEDLTPERLEARRQVKSAQLKMLKREL